MTTRNNRTIRPRRRTNPRRRQAPGGVVTRPAAYTNAFYQTFTRKSSGPTNRVSRYSSSTLSFVTSTSVEVNQPIYFTLDSVAGSSDFTALYDQYRITSVDVELMPSNEGLTSGALVIAPDYDDATATNVNSLLQYASAKRFPVGKPIFLHIAGPAVDATVFGTSGAAPGLNLRSPWIDCGKADVQHYGLKLASTVTGTSFTFQVMVRYHLEFRYIR